MRRAPRLDANQHAIVAEFERLGCSVVSLAGAAGGVPDLLIALRGPPCLTWLLSVRTGPKARQGAF